MQLSFIKLKTEQLKAAFEVVLASKIHLLDQGIDQWDEIYPTESHLHADIQNGEAFGGFENGQLVAYVALNKLSDPEYDALNWWTETPALIVHRLVVDPRMQGKGVGKFLMSQVYEFGLQNAYKSIRLDAFIPNVASNKLYEKIGYRKVGIIQLRKGYFNCYELPLV